MSLFEATPAELLGRLNDVEATNAPERLYLAGDPNLLKRGPRVSVVGTRSVSEKGVQRARILTRALVRHGIVVVSGLAEGIDTVAHRTAITEGGRTVAVVGTGLDRAYPKSNEALQTVIARDHLVVSQFPPSTPPRRGNFPMRNRTMALVTEATVIVEAREKSGTRHQGWEALRLGRLVFLLESVAANQRLSWPADMINYGAQVLSRDNLHEILEDLPEPVGAEELPV